MPDAIWRSGAQGDQRRRVRGASRSMAVYDLGFCTRLQVPGPKERAASQRPEADRAAVARRIASSACGLPPPRPRPPRSARRRRGREQTSRSPRRRSRSRAPRLRHSRAVPERGTYGGRRHSASPRLPAGRYHPCSVRRARVRAPLAAARRAVRHGECRELPADSALRLAGLARRDGGGRGWTATRASDVRPGVGGRRGRTGRAGEGTDEFVEPVPGTLPGATYRWHVLELRLGRHRLAGGGRPPVESVPARGRASRCGTAGPRARARIVIGFARTAPGRLDFVDGAARLPAESGPLVVAVLLRPDDAGPGSSSIRLLPSSGTYLVRGSATGTPVASRDGHVHGGRDSDVDGARDRVGTLAVIVRNRGMTWFRRGD
jgi:hypothetical protein